MINLCTPTRKAVSVVNCKRKNCATCLQLHKNSYYVSSLTKRKYKVIGYSNLSCASKNIIYLLTCSKCDNQYVGETKQTLSKRLSGHRSAIKKKVNTFISKHFNLPDHSVDDIRIQPIEEIEQQAGETDREKYWMLELGTVYPYGLNDRLQNVGNVSKASLKHLYVFSLLNRRKRRTRSHGYRSNKRKNLQTTVEALYNVFTCGKGLHNLLTKIHSLQLSDLHKLFLKCRNNNLRLDNRFLNIILDVCCSKLFLPVRSNNPASKVRHRFIKIYYHNKGIGKIKLNNILRNKLVNSKIPLYFKYKEPPFISYKHTHNISKKVFNYNSVV